LGVVELGELDGELDAGESDGLATGGAETSDVWRKMGGEWANRLDEAVGGELHPESIPPSGCDGSERLSDEKLRLGVRIGDEAPDEDAANCCWISALARLLLSRRKSEVFRRRSEADSRDKDKSLPEAPPDERPAPGGPRRP